MSETSDPDPSPPAPVTHLRRSAQDAGAGAVEALRRRLAWRTARLLREDPGAADLAAEMGLVDPRWLERPSAVSLNPSAPLDVLERFLERSVEQRPSRLGTIGLSAVQLVSSRADPNRTGQERVTVVFTDLEGFTAYTDLHGDDEALSLLGVHHRAAGPVVRRWQGRVVKRLGDGLLCAFPDAETGVRAALELLGTAPAPLTLRAGVHTGEALVSRSDVIGGVVNVAARVAEETVGGEVTVTDEVVAGLLPTAGIEIGSARRRRLKGVAEPVVLYRAALAHGPEVER